MSRDNVSLAVVRRLPRYYRHLHELLGEGVTRISSRLLADRLGLTASQIRQDLNCFGGFGQQGYGYNVEKLCREIGDILGLGAGLRAVIIGMGHIGHALCNNFDFLSAGVTLVGAFDVAEGVVGSSVGGLTVLHADELETFAAQTCPEIGILTLSRSDARAMCRRLSALPSVRGLWNFTSEDIRQERDGKPVEYVNYNDSLMTLCYRITNSRE
ncbi:MAG: redox-sensing transcriptional repressor Rex [Oscillospiraceae bacterium]|jgi:redox-sensing transcriptional repressor|nr:redox-sensing transcriptional repressor Rex [Oscillospiraceae bacterium]